MSKDKEKATPEKEGLQLVENANTDVSLRLRCLEMAAGAGDILSKMHEAKTMYNWIVGCEKPSKPIKQ
ncbi:hypothetical protein SAMN05421780_11121 [Flexibacter flexilis DSM 6793]|uniref:Uncharacterized protein n=1 Tax=Flexibacter flexilis DSM 6793 TaxID=927664 RepID=A0A1I1MQ46_9BACT|nr:hypothetical protein [Flexibacter flexilis]SFC86992.1 hypothetical protein SAMN05421780_11121 [Flexibacter flexilis DSM 6793]